MELSLKARRKSFRIDGKGKIPYITYIVFIRNGRKTMGTIKDNMAKLKCSECGNITYYTQRNKKKVKEKLEMNKHCKFCRKHTTHAEKK